MPRNICFFDLLPIELLYTLFTYFLAHEILLSFSNISDHVDAVLLSYSCYRVDFNSILKCHFDLICRQIRPDQVISLKLSDNDDTPGQTELFLSRFRIKHFTRLQSLILGIMEYENLESIFSNMNQLNQLCSFSFHSDRIKWRYPAWIRDSTHAKSRIDSLILKTYDQVIPQLTRYSCRDGNMLTSKPLPCLRYLTLKEATVDELQIIFSQVSKLRSLNVGLTGDVSNIKFLSSPYQLTRLILTIIGKDCILRVERMYRILHLKIIIKD
jgi:hypothetical protein